MTLFSYRINLIKILDKLSKILSLSVALPPVKFFVALPPVPVLLPVALPPVILLSCLVPEPSHSVALLPVALYKFQVLSGILLMPLPLCLSPNILTLYEYPMQLCSMPLPLSTLYNYAQKIWIKLISSPLFEFYIRAIFVILQSFDIVFENDFPLYNCLKINLALRRHFYRLHDYKVLADKVTCCSAICIHPIPMFIIFFINYIFALRVINIFIFKPVLTSALYLCDVLIYNTYHQIIHCYKDLDNSEPETTKATGGGPSYELNYDDLSDYSDQVRKDMKYLFYTYVLEAEKSLLESTDLISISNIPLNIILPKLTVENLKLVAKLRV